MKRGQAITAIDGPKIKMYDDLISESIKNEDNYDLFTKPVVAFITFESDDGYNEALSYSKTAWYKKLGAHEEHHENEISEILGQKPIFVAATEPTNIIWENRHIKGIKFGARACSAFVIIAFMLGLTFTFILGAK